MRLPRVLSASLAIALVFGAAASARGQSLPKTVLWSACDTGSGAPSGEAPITLHDLAVRARPALWFSRDEPLVDLDGPLPREWPRPNARDATPEDLVYYRITRIKSTSSDDDLVRALHARVPANARPLITAARANPEAIAAIPLDLELLRQLKELVVRYLFYYPNELGSHSHAHDLESVELRIVIEDADERGDPRALNPSCRQIRVATLYGAAHGLGLYTNVLDLDAVLKDRLAETETVVESTSRRTSVQPGPGGVPAVPGVVAAPAIAEKIARTDPFWPLIVFVEEGKHASAPDRNGDGVFTPNFDVNRYASDAWGIRDTMRSNQLSPVFKSDTFKKRVPEIAVDSNGTLRPAEGDNPWAVQAFNRYVRYDYQLRRPTEDRIVCGDPLRPVDDRRQSMTQYATNLRAQVRHGNPHELLAGKAFCDDVNVQSRVNAVDVFGKLSFGGAYNGFTEWYERISGSIRIDGGPGWSTTVPIGLQVPGVGGWIVGRLSGPMPDSNARRSFDVAYMPSAARFADWYVAGGIDYGHHESSSGVEDGARPAAEIGVKFRVPLAGKGAFLGGRIGIRANGSDSLQNPRIVFEFGAGIW
jgi:hypothetical protein